MVSRVENKPSLGHLEVQMSFAGPLALGPGTDDMQMKSETNILMVHSTQILAKDVAFTK